MPHCDYKKYDPEWKSRIRPDIIKRAENKCEECGVKNKEFGYRDKDGKFYEWQIIEDALELHGWDMFDHELSNCYDKQGNPTKGTTIVLTIAHLDHNINNNDYSNLKALCQRCHFLKDIQQHKETRKRNRGLQNLFP